MNPKILVCAFACVKDPDTRFGFGEGGESGLGWGMINQIRKFGSVFVLTDAGNKEAIEKKVHEEKTQGVSFYYIGLPKSLIFSKKIIQVYAYLWQIKAYFFAKKLHKENKFDLFHHVTYGNDWMASYIGALLPIPYIRGPGGGAHKVPYGFLKEYPFKDQLAQIFRSFGQWLFRHDPFFIIGQNRAKAIFVCNKESFNNLKEKWQKKASFFPVNGLSEEDLATLKGTPKENEDFLILSAGKLIKIKGFDLLIKSLKVFSDEVDNARLVLIGDGPEIENLKKITKNLNLGDKIIFKEWLKRADLLKEIKASDIFLFCSLRDGGGQVIIEAMGAGKPVVCMNIAGPGFHVDDACGIKIEADVPEKAVKGIANALKKLYFDRSLLLKLGEGAREKVEKKYNWDKLGERVIETYKNVLRPHDSY